MDFMLSTEQALIRDTVRSYCRSNYRFQDRLTILASPEGFSREHWKAYAELGWLGVTLPEDVGGSSGSAVDMALILEEFGRHLVLEPFVACAVLAAHVVDALATPVQRRRTLSSIVRGESILALAHSEPEALGDLQFLTTRARRREQGGWVITGRKSLVLGGSGADELIVTARTAGDARDRHGVTAFLLRPDTPGLTRRCFRTVDGGHAADLELRNVEVGPEALLGLQDEVLAPIEDATDRAIVAVCAEAVGAMDAAVAGTGDFLKTRRAYGATLSTLQALQHRVADIATELEVSRSMLHSALGALDSAERMDRRETVAAAKALIGRSGRVVGSHALQLHGGMGMSDDYVIGHLFKRLTVIETLFGNSHFHLTQYAGMSEVRAADIDASDPFTVWLRHTERETTDAQDHASSQAAPG